MPGGIKCVQAPESQRLAKVCPALARPNLSAFGGRSNLSLIEEIALDLLLPSCVTLSKLLSFSDLLLLHWENMATSNTCPCPPPGVLCKPQSGCKCAGRAV